MQLRGRYGQPPVPPPEPAPTPPPLPGPRPVPAPVPTPPPLPDPRLSVSAVVCSSTPARERVSAAAVTIGAVTAGSGSALSTGGVGSRGAATGRSGFRSRRSRIGLLILLRPSRSAFGGGAF